ncbi:Zinc finger protein [Plakobranchus ocellatus]|uniref:Zinc finger protein n=1 Tax=Plakobranchus ocellatus TaxID=259542 RepID=A0AAV3ZVV9_9GAST|nr:Zinc finger protein [Plakobranchus ocellatus]
MSVARDSIIGTHQGIRRTIDKVLSNFNSLGVDIDVAKYSRSFDACHQTVPTGSPDCYAFQAMAIDIIKRGKVQILALDYNIRYAKAILYERLMPFGG